MTCCVTKAISMHFIDEKCSIKQLKSGKSHKTCLTNHTWSISHYIMPLVINALGGGQRQTDRHMYTHTDMQTKAISRNQMCTGHRSVCSCFKNHTMLRLCKLHPSLAQFLRRNYYLSLWLKIYMVQPELCVKCFVL